MARRSATQSWPPTRCRTCPMSNSSRSDIMPWPRSRKPCSPSPAGNELNVRRSTRTYTPTAPGAGMLVPAPDPVFAMFWLGWNPEVGSSVGLLSLATDVLFAPDNGQLQHPCILSFRQQIHENRVSVRKRQGIVMLMLRVRFNRAEPGNAKTRALG